MHANEDSPRWHSLSACDTLTRLEASHEGLFTYLRRLAGSVCDRLGLVSWGRILRFGVIVSGEMGIKKVIIRSNYASPHQSKNRSRPLLPSGIPHGCLLEYRRSLSPVGWARYTRNCDFQEKNMNHFDDEFALLYRSHRPPRDRQHPR